VVRISLTKAVTDHVSGAADRVQQGPFKKPLSILERNREIWKSHDDV